MIHIWLPVKQDSIRLYNDGQWQQHANWDELSKALQSSGINTRSVCLYIPSVNVTQIQEPMTRQRLRQLGDTGISYLLEDYVLHHVDELYIRHAMSSEEEVVLTSIAKQQIAQYRQSVSLIQLELSAVLPDFMLIEAPEQADTTHVYADNTTMLMRLNDYAGSYIGQASDDLALVASKLTETSHFQLSGVGADALLQTAEQTGKTAAISARGMIPVEFPERHPLNLFPRTKRRGLPTYWRAVAAVFAVAMVSMLIYDGLRIWQYQQLEQNYQAQIIKQYKQWFPNERPPVDIKKTIASKMSSEADQSNALFGLMSSVSPMLKQSGLTANRISFEQAQDSGNDKDNAGKLAISLNAPDISELQTLVSKMTTQGINAQLGNVTPVDANVEGIINVLP